MKRAKKNPRGSKGKFARCVEDVKARGSAYDPRAVCAASERKVYGQKELTRRAIAGKRRAARGNPGTVTEWKKDFYRKGLEVGRKDRGASFPHFESGSAVSSQGDYMAETAVQYHGFPASKKSALSSEFVKGYWDGQRGRRKRNPADASAAAYEKFHGEPPTQYITVTEKIHYHGHLWTVGTLEGLKILTVDGTSQVKLSGFRGAILAANEQAFAELSRTGKARAQLFIKNGDQSVHLEDFGIDPDRAHEVETLGRATAVLYETNKVHLGDEGGDAVYEHKFRRTREGEAEVKVRWARYPDVIYRVLDQRLEFAGGSYELIAEGINL